MKANTLLLLYLVDLHLALILAFFLFAMQSSYILRNGRAETTKTETTASSPNKA